MRLFQLALLISFLASAAHAAESLNPEDMDKTFVPLQGSAITCAKAPEEKADQSCSSGVPATTKSLTGKVLRDAEHQITSENLANPQRNNPDVLPLPTQLPPQEMSLPKPQELMNMWNSRPPM
jgi:hypothetical protein